MVAHIEVWDAPRRVLKYRQQGGNAALLARKQVGVDSSWLSNLQAPDQGVNTGWSNGCVLVSCLPTWLILMAPVSAHCAHMHKTPHLNVAEHQ